MLRIRFFFFFLLALLYTTFVLPRATLGFSAKVALRARQNIGRCCWHSRRRENFSDPRHGKASLGGRSFRSRSPSSTSLAMEKKRSKSEINGDMEDELREQIDISRDELRLESFEGYILISILTSTCSVETLTQFSPPDDPNLQYWHIGTLLVASFSALFGMYATLVFTLTQLYGRTALGLSQYEAEVEFLEKTADIRVRGFQASYASLFLFLLTIILVAGEDLPDLVRPVFLAGSTALFAVFLKDWKKIIDTATPIFAETIPEKMENGFSATLVPSRKAGYGKSNLQTQCDGEASVIENEYGESSVIENE